MRTVIVLGISLFVTMLKLLRPGGVRTVAAECIVLKHQLLISQRGRQRAPNLSSLDRTLLGLATLFILPKRISKVSVLLKPATLLKFHKALVRRKYNLLFSVSHHYRKPGPKGPAQEVIHLIVAMKRRNPRFGCVRIAQQISNTFGLDIDKDVVRRVLAKHYQFSPPDSKGPSWLTFIGHMEDSLWSVDLFRCESLLLRSRWVMVIMDVFTRRLVGFGIARGPIDGLSVCRMFNSVIAGQPLPNRLSMDHDPLFRFHRWLANLRVLDVEEIKSVPYTPVSHPFVERLIGTIRREYLDYILFWNTADLKRKLDDFRDYYNAHRVHRALNGTTPAQQAGKQSTAQAKIDRYSWRSHCRGLFILPVSA